jgi:hypothetical protein
MYATHPFCVIHLNYINEHKLPLYVICILLSLNILPKSQPADNIPCCESLDAHGTAGGKRRSEEHIVSFFKAK